MSELISKCVIKLCYYVKALYFSGLLWMLVLASLRPLDDAIEEYDQVMEMNFCAGLLQMFLNNEKYYKE